jgi:hypothetical protein
MTRQRKAWIGKTRRDNSRHGGVREGKARLVKARLG